MTYSLMFSPLKYFPSEITHLLDVAPSCSRAEGLQSVMPSFVCRGFLNIDGSAVTF